MKGKKMNIDNLTFGELKQIASMFNSTKEATSVGLGSDMIGHKVIIRTYSAGVWFGVLDQKAGNEVILKNARRMYKWWATESISLSAVSIHGIIHDKSKICEAVDQQWLEAIEITPCTYKAIKSIEGAENVKAQ